LNNIVSGLISSANNGILYNINTFNCVNVAVNIGNIVGLNFPSCESPQTYWDGQTPAQMHNVISNMPTPAGGSKNTTGGIAPLNNCN